MPRSAPLLVVPFAILAMASVLYATPYGPGTGWDQSMYVGSARNVLNGSGLSIPWGTDAGQPLTHFPPLFPLSLAAIGALGIDPLDGARYMNAVLRGVNLVLLGLLMTRLTPRSVVGPLTAMFLFFTSVHMATLHDEAWSEPLFLPLCFGALYLLARYVAHPNSVTTLLAAAALTTAAILTRYVGLSVALTGGVLIVAATRMPIHRKLRDLALYATLSIVPLVAWAGRNAVLGQLPLGYRQLAWHPAQPAQLGQLVYILFDWFAPNQLTTRLASADGHVTVLGFAALAVPAAVSIWCVRHMSRNPFLRLVLPVFLGVYLLTVFAAMSVFDNLIQIDSRTLSPIYLALIIFVGVAAANLERVSVTARVTLLGVAGVLALTYVGRFAISTERVHAEGMSYASTRYLTSSVMRHVAQLPADAAIYSNAPDAVYVLTSRRAFAIPDATTLDANVALIEAQLRQDQPVYVAFFDDPEIAYRQLVPTILEGYVGLAPVAQDASGSVARVVQETAHVAD